MRSISRCFEKNPQLRPSPTPLDMASDLANFKGSALSPAQAAQIEEIFQLFDTDGTGCIEREEIKFALSALGFHTIAGKGNHPDYMAAFQAILGDGKVTLDEFSALMTGEIGGHKPYEEARAVFALLSRSDGDEAKNELITLGKLEAVCTECQVFFASFIPVNMFFFF